MAAVALASAGTCNSKEEKPAISPTKVANSKLNVKTPEPTQELTPELIPEPTPDSLQVPAQSLTTAAPHSPSAKSASPKPKKEIKSKTLSKKPLNSETVSQDIVGGNVDVNKLIKHYDSIKIPVSKPKPKPALEGPMAVISAKLDRVSKINWEDYDSKLSQK